MPFYIENLTIVRSVCRKQDHETRSHLVNIQKVKLSNDQEPVQSEPNANPKHRNGKNQSDNPIMDLDKISNKNNETAGTHDDKKIN